MSEQISLRAWIDKFKLGLYDENNRKTQINAGWYDWFCRDTSLANKTKKMGQVVKQIKDGDKINLDKNYVWFKNNCPMRGPLYDDFRIADLETGDVLFTVQFNSPWEDFNYTVYGRFNDFQKPLFKTNSSKELVKWLNMVD